MIKRDNQNVIWVKIKKELVELENDLYLGTLYHSPSGNSDSISTKYESLNDDIFFFQGKGTIILQGDFNARTNNSPDYIENENLVDKMGLN